MALPFSEFLTIGEIADVKGGKRLPKGMVVQDQETSHPYLRVVDFNNDGIDRSNVKYINDDAFARVKRYTITNEDIYISIAGTIGRVGVIPKDLSGANLTENAAKITNINSDTDKIFLMYYLRSHLGQSEIASKVVGTSQPKLALFRIQELKVPQVPLPTQRKIAAILSSYDDLIENNLRRIKILEEMAENLYREWFVKFHFPGHEKNCFVDSPLGQIPERWEVKRLGEILELNYGKALKQGDRRGGSVPVYGSSGVVGYHDVSLAKGPGIVIGRKGNVGSIFWSNDDFYVIDTAYFVSSPLPLRFLFYDLQTKNFLNNDAAVPGLNRNQAYSLETVMPENDILKRFCEFADAFELQASALRNRNIKLRRTRDLLLPRLISGDVDVSDLDINIPEEAV